ncbi:MAG: hypothetical protein LPJ89_01405 [Hymenobacteraceae bacterium]|nr:hypothetical protein [Hymenobacteraceae bacterium]MDX5397101.1 hypothetical protein [Hymenobacteraceae bacterium]MDX5442419.1 hypothetical protein [Hymenobacteraceae bacterium]MDX5513179.1 hypothetical protein [Hymenobacteraceae bacterium]
MHTKLYIGLVSLLLLGFCSCGSSSKTSRNIEKRQEVQQHPTWMNKLIAGILEEKPANPPAKIYSYTYQGQEVFYLTGHCCDVPATLYNAQGQVLCLPDGGITGKGDGRCPDFHSTKTNEKLIWEDNR